MVRRRGYVASYEIWQNSKNEYGFIWSVTCLKTPTSGKDVNIESYEVKLRFPFDAFLQKYRQVERKDTLDISSHIRSCGLFDVRCQYTTNLAYEYVALVE
jgi:hypothetical protein